MIDGRKQIDCIVERAAAAEAHALVERARRWGSAPLRPMPLPSRAALHTVLDIRPFLIDHDENGNPRISRVERAVCIVLIVLAIYAAFGLLSL